MADEIEKAEEKEDLNGSNSHSSNDSSSEMLKPWLKTLGKDYYRNERLGQYERLTDAIDDLLEKSKPKDIPDRYGLRDGSDDVFRKAGLTKEEAEEVDRFYSGLIPKEKPSLKDVFKENYDETMRHYEDGIKAVSDDLKDRISKEGLDKDPLFVEIMSRVGKETGETEFREDKNPKGAVKSDPAMDAVRRAYEAYYGKK